MHPIFRRLNCLHGDSVVLAAQRLMSVRPALAPSLAREPNQSAPLLTDR